MATAMSYANMFRSSDASFHARYYQYIFRDRIPTGSHNLDKYALLSKSGKMMLCLPLCVHRRDRKSVV